MVNTLSRFEVDCENWGGEGKGYFKKKQGGENYLHEGGKNQEIVLNGKGTAGLV